jgi:glycerol uptake facilitator-like aquaporin
MISELVGTFMFVFLFMLSTDKKTQFSDDKVINCFIISASYVAARLMAGGEMATVIFIGAEVEMGKGYALREGRRPNGPLLNPALAFGQMVCSTDFSHIIQYCIMPMAGSVIALVFYELVFVKSQEYLNEATE